MHNVMFHSYSMNLNRLKIVDATLGSGSPSVRMSSVEIGNAGGSEAGMTRKCFDGRLSPLGRSVKVMIILFDFGNHPFTEIGSFPIDDSASYSSEFFVVFIIGSCRILKGNDTSRLRSPHHGDPNHIFEDFQCGMAVPALLTVVHPGRIQQYETEISAKELQNKVTVRSCSSCCN